MKILYWDIETSPVIAAVWGLYDQNIPYQHVIQEWHIICAAWKWDGGGEIESITANGKDDKRVVRKLHSLVSHADAVIAHNGDKFDMKKLMARVIKHGLDPVPPVKNIDTLKMARKYGFTSKRLDDLGKFLETGRKSETERGLWVDAAQGSKSAIDKLEAYCRDDIPPLEALYNRLRPYAPIQINANLFTDRPCCPKCKSVNMQSRGYKVTVVSKQHRWQCQDCGSWSLTTPRVKGAYFK